MNCLCFYKCICYFRALLLWDNLHRRTDILLRSFAPSRCFFLWFRSSNYLFRCGSSLRASFKQTTLATADTLTLSPSLLTDHFVPLEARMERRCYGTWTNLSTYTHFLLAMKFTLWFFHRTDTGSALPRLAALLYLIWRRRTKSISWSQSIWRLARRAGSRSVWAWLGVLTVQRFSQDIRIIGFGCG